MTHVTTLWHHVKLQGQSLWNDLGLSALLKSTMVIESLLYLFSTA